MNLIKHSLEEYSILFTEPVDVLEHLFCTSGNGYDSDSFNELKLVKEDDYEYSIGGAEIFADQFKDLPICCPYTLYPWNEQERFQAFRRFGSIEIPEHYEGIREAARYFIKCLEFCTEERMKERWANWDRAKHLLERGYFETRGYPKMINDWKTYGIPAMKEFFKL